MIDYKALTIAKQMSDHPAPGVKMSGGDLPKWDADMEYWLDSEITVYDNPHYIFADGFDNFDVSGVIENA